MEMGSHAVRDPEHEEEESDEILQKLQMIRVKFLRLAHRLGRPTTDEVVARVLYRLGLAEQQHRRSPHRPVADLRSDRAGVLEAEQLEAAGQEPLDFSCTIMVIGRTGVGKSATVNSIFDEARFRTDAFRPGTGKARDVAGTVRGVRLRVIDTPGLLSPSSDQQRNGRILRSVKRFVGRTRPDVVLYFDRLDIPSRDYGDAPMLGAITAVFGAAIWDDAVIALTHAASPPPEGPNGAPSGYEMFVAQRSRVVQQAIRQAAGDEQLMNPVCLVENHPTCRTNRAGQRVLPNGQVWEPQLLLLSFAFKILAEANMLFKPLRPRARAPPLPSLLASLLEPRRQSNEETMVGDLDDASDSDDGSDYDELPPFKRLSKARLEKLSKALKDAYLEELDYRERLFFKKQLKEEKRSRQLRTKMAGDSASVPIPDYVLPASFDSDNPSHRYRSTDSSSRWLVRPVLDPQVWDHDVGYGGLNIESKYPVSISGQLTKDKTVCNFIMAADRSINHDGGGAPSFGLAVETVGIGAACTLRGEAWLKRSRRNSAAAGVSVTVLGGSVSTGLKVEDRLIIGKTFGLLLRGGAVTCRGGGVAYGGQVEATWRERGYRVGRMLLSLAVSAMEWHGDSALGCSVESQFPLGRGSTVVGRASLNNRGAGLVGFRLNSSEQLQIALLALVPILLCKMKTT